MNRVRRAQHAGLVLLAWALFRGLGFAQGQATTSLPAVDSRVARGSFTLSTTRLVLTDVARSAVLQIRNDSGRSLPVTVELLKWDQQRQGDDLILQPTNELVYFPRSFVLKPDEVRNVRVGTSSGVGLVEQAYRLIVQEAPGAAPPGQGAGISFRLRQSLPVFVLPQVLKPEARLDSVTVANGKVTVVVANIGNVHGIATNVSVRGMSERNAPVVFTAQRPGWYILAGRVQQYQVDLPRDKCEQSRTLAVDVRISEASLSQEIVVSPPACRGKATQ